MSDSVTYPTHSYAVVGPGMSPVNSGLVATGTTQGTALQLIGGKHIVTSAPANSGVILPKLRCYDIVVLNRDPSNNLNVYPPIGETIEGQAVNTPLAINPNNGAIFTCADGPTVIFGTWFVQ